MGLHPAHQQHRAGQPGPASSSWGWLRHWTVCGGQLSKRQDMPGQERRLPPSPDSHCASPGCQTSACSPCTGMPFTHRWYEPSLEELPSPLPPPWVGLFLPGSPTWDKGTSAVPWEGRFLFAECWDLHLHPGSFPAGRVQLQLWAAAQDTASSSVLQPTDRTDLPSAQLGITDESKGTLGCIHHSILVTVLPAIPTGGTCLQLCRPTTSPYFRW